MKLNSIREILYRELMIAHILINDPSSDIDGFIIINFLCNFAKALQCFLEFINSMIHQTEVEPAADKILLQLESLFVHIDCLVYQLHILFFAIFERLFSLALVS
jgi:hypothetical protein